MTALVSASDEPDFDVYLTENIVAPGEETTLQLEIRNAASPYEDDSDVGDPPPTEARDVTVELNETDAPVDVKTNETPVPTMSAQTLLSESFTIAVDEDAEAGTYELEAEIEYTHGEDDSSTDTETVTIVVEERARFEAVDVRSGLVVGDRGLVTLELNNTGVENASDAVVQFESPDQNVQTITPAADESGSQTGPAGGAALQPVAPTSEGSDLQTSGSTEYVGDWEINETATVQAAMDVDADAVARTYPVSVTVDFRDGEGVDRTSREVRVGAETAPEQQFAVENLETDLYVGEDGTIEGTIVNDGPKPVNDTVLVVDDGEEGIVPNLEEGLGSGSNVYPRETQYAVGDLQPGETAPFEFRVGIGGEAEPGPRVMEANVRYRNIHDDVRTTQEPVDLPLEVAPERDEFDVDVLNATQKVGETQEISLQVTNTKSETLTDIEAKLYTNDPLDNHDDEGFIPSLEPGESATVTFEVEVSDDATPQTYPLRMDFRYDDERSNSQLTDTYRIPLEVVEPEEGISTQAILAAVGLLGGVVAVCWWFRARIAAALEGVPVLGRIGDLELPGPIAKRLGEDESGGSGAESGTRTGYGGHSQVETPGTDAAESAFGYDETDDVESDSDVWPADTDEPEDASDPSVERTGPTGERLEYDETDADDSEEQPADSGTESNADR
ncbi:hypothetical protein CHINAEXTREME_15805 [Halobiforma lacisalsi AJ5]|uniref:Alpha-galactosidase NEW3 domain-containing protein n=1 Tax=Natronobacterium lacisalsi AJ5 TaxID=358396 RepID=M0LCW5_NATLA|nr:COG1361 S-layer family protein [Halobiforma lacisalsi]APW99146.1 hypothetical protein CHINAEXTREME_15805 [Halobiforma lacisalsi AJ5]EMA30953.1 hypothetical protein C445_15406 [Halobiforma lacisalsi AJ5]